MPAMTLLADLSLSGIIKATTLIVLSGLLLLDGTSSTLLPRDPVSGREMACYTIVERVAGVRHPSAIRPAELVGGIFLAFATAAWLDRRRKRAAM